MPSRQYSATEHLAKSLFLSRWKEVWWGMFAAYFDESRLYDQFPVVAGFVGITETWIAVEKEMGKVQKKKSYRKGPLATKLAESLGNNAILPVYASIDRKLFQPLYAVFSGVSFRRPLVYIMSNAYATCSWFCCEIVDEWAEKKKLRKEHWPIKMVFDDGNENKVSLERGYRTYYQEKKENTYLHKVPIFEDGDSSWPLIAADAFAWHLSRFHNLGHESEFLRLLFAKNLGQCIVVSETRPKVILE